MFVAATLDFLIHRPSETIDFRDASDFSPILLRIQIQNIGLHRGESQIDGLQAVGNRLQCHVWTASPPFPRSITSSPYSLPSDHFFVCPRAKMLATKFRMSVALDSLYP